MSLTTADFALVCAAVSGLVVGGFVGFSGALSFVVASLAAAAVGRFGWTWLGLFFAQDWSRALATLVAALLTFGIIRALVRKLTGLALKQPADFLFGALIGAAATGALAFALVWGLVQFGIVPIDSVILTEVKSLVG